MVERLEPTREGNWLDWGGSGPPLHFAHANGFPPATFRKLIEVLRTRHHVYSVEARPLWPHLQHLRVPSLFIQGEHSDAFFPNAVSRVRREVPGARAEVFEGYGHCVPMQVLQGVGEAILRAAAEVTG